MLRILIPFLLRPGLMANQYVVVRVDNIGCYCGWLNRQSNDRLASVLIRALHIISGFLGCVVHIEHLPRRSSWDACLMDRLSRTTTTTQGDKWLINRFKAITTPQVLSDWMNNPKEDWSLPDRLLRFVKNSVQIE